MNVPPQPPLGEEPEKDIELQNIDKTPEQPAPTPATAAHEDTTEQSTTASASTSHENETTYPLTSTEIVEHEHSTEQPEAPAETAAHEEEIAEEPTIHASTDEESSTPQPMIFSESATAAENTATEDTIVDDEALEDEDGEEEEEEDDTTTQSAGSGVFVKKSVLIGVISAVVLVALLGSLLFFVMRPKDPPTDWLTSVTPPAGSGSASKILYYLHWTNNNGELKGKLDLAAYANGAPQSISDDAVGLYSRDNHVIYVVVTNNGQPVTFAGKINDNNDTLTLTLVGGTGQSSQLIFHTSSSDNYKQETKKLAPAKK